MSSHLFGLFCFELRNIAIFFFEVMKGLKSFKTILVVPLVYLLLCKKGVGKPYLN